MVSDYLIILIVVVLVIFIGLILFKKKTEKKQKEEQVAAGMQIFDSTGKTVFDSNNNTRQYAYMVETFRVHVPAGVGYTRGTRVSPVTVELAGRGATPFLFSSAEGQRDSKYGRFYPQVEFVPGTYTIRWNAFRLQSSYYFDVYIGVYV